MMNKNKAGMKKKMAGEVVNAFAEKVPQLRALQMFSRSISQSRSY